MCNINYHMVWSVKYRRKILNPEIEEYLKELVQQIAEDKGFTVHLFECGEGDHVHCFVSAPPKLSITAIVKYLKGITGRKLFERFPEIRNQLWKGELWNHSYYVETIGSVSEENIRRYIEHHPLPTNPIFPNDFVATANNPAGQIPQSTDVTCPLVPTL